MAPITSPLPAGLAPSNGYPDPNSNYMQPGGGQYMQPQVQPSMYNPSMAGGGGPQPSSMSANANTINYQNFQQTAPGATASAPPTGAPGQLGGPHGSVFYPGQGQQQDGGSYVQQQNAYQPPAPEPPKQKPPLPEQYVFMQIVFEELKRQCVASAGNPQTKRKLEDVSKRLESLYDLLRENRLSQNTLNSLNQLVALIQAGDYANGIGLHTQMVSGSDFAQIASFMPGIKVLLQSAMQLQVYLR